MADPISIIAGVIGIATVVVQSSKALSKLIDNIKGAPNEIKALARDVHAFRSILSSLKIALEERDVKDAVRADTTLIEMIGNLTHPLKNCDEALQSLVSGIQRGYEGCKGSTFRKSARSLRRGMFARTEIEDVQSRLEATKSTLNAALESITMLSSVRTMAATQPGRWRGPSNDINLNIGFLTHETLNRDIRLKDPSNQVPESNGRLSSLRDRLQELHSPLIGDFGEKSAFEALPLVRYLAEMSLELSSHSVQIQQLKMALERSQHTPDEESVHSEIATTVDVFYDCASRLADGECDTTLEMIEKAFVGSPKPRFETSTDFYPEQYTLDDRFHDRLSVHAMIQSQEDEKARKLFITYAQARRGWRRVVVSAAFRTGPTHPDYQCALHCGRKVAPEVLPNSLIIILNDLLRRLELLASITHVSLPLMIEEESGEPAVDVDGVRAVEDHHEVALCNDSQILQDIEDMNCAVFLESEIVVKSRVSVSEFEVFVESQICSERKAPFPSATATGRNSFQEFCDDIRMLARLRGCQGAIQLVGVVLDDSRKYLRSYLCESVNPNLEQILGSAASLSLQVPWNIRETWARQLITAIGEVHGKGAVLGNICLGYTNIRADGSLVLASYTRSYIATVQPGHVAPELRTSGKMPLSSTEGGALTSRVVGTEGTNGRISTTTAAEPFATQTCVDEADKGLPQSPNFRTDIFTLGLLLFHLAEHKVSLTGYWCVKDGCTNRPRYACKAAHKDPIELPDCQEAVPAYFQEMIRKCRSRDPKDRPSARQLLAMFPDEVRNGIAPPDLTKVTTMFPPLAVGHSTYCDECGSPTTDDYYHCNICNNDNFDFCPSCVAQGVGCYVPEHKLIRKGRMSAP
ncbi:MAG: hypothetical protein Q9207_006311 [Kuettlingeria erythrocarpa]